MCYRGDTAWYIDYYELRVIALPLLCSGVCLSSRLRVWNRMQNAFCSVILITVVIVHVFSSKLCCYHQLPTGILSLSLLISFIHMCSNVFAYAHVYLTQCNTLCAHVSWAQTTGLLVYNVMFQFDDVLLNINIYHLWATACVDYESVVNERKSLVTIIIMIISIGMT